MTSIRQMTGIMLVLAAMLATVLATGHARQLESSREQEVGIPSSDVVLSATLTLPVSASGRRAPSLLIVPEWGEVTRDGSAGNSTYREIAGSLSNRGIAALRYDRRCSGKSTCKPRSSFEDYVEDVTAAIKYLRQRSEIDPARIAILGHGFGGLIAMTALLAMEPEARPALLVLAATPGRTGSKLVREQVKSRLARDHKTAEEAQKYLADVDQWLSSLESGGTLSAGSHIDPGDVLLRSFAVQPEVAMFMLTADPLRTIRAITAPVLLIQGETDLAVTPTDARYIAEALKRSGQSDVSLELVPKADHWFSPDVTSGTNTLASWLVRKFAID